MWAQERAYGDAWQSKVRYDDGLRLASNPKPHIYVVFISSTDITPFEARSVLDIA